MTDHIVALTTVANEQDAALLATGLLERRVVACVNILPGMESLYFWKGAVAREPECLLMMKTRADAFDALSAAFDELHPYEVPELIALPVSAGAQSYLSWVDENLST